ncbi:MAG: hypothetical protein IJY65_04395 [Clostridia bacterium]|nr:hypothetical protein [Clostridia bacterium]
MKHIKKIFLSVLIVAMLVSVLAMVASAQSLEVDANNFADVLEYYTNTQISESFEDLAVGIDYTTVAPDTLEFDAANSEATVEVVEVDGQKALKLTGASTTTTTKDFYFVSPVAADAEGFGIDVSYKPNEDGIKNIRSTVYGIFTIYAVPADGGDPIALVELNPVDKSKNTLKVLDKVDNGDGTFDNELKTVDGVAIKNNVHYEVSYYYNVAANQFTLTVTAVGDGATLGTVGSTYTYTGSYAEALNVSATKSGFAEAHWYNTKNFNYIYSYRAYTGSFAQGTVCEKVHDEVGEYITVLGNIFADANTSADQKSAIVEMVAEIVGSYNFKSSDAAVNATVDNILLDAQKTWGASFVAAMPNLDPTAAYADRVAFIESISKFYNVIAEKAEIEGIDSTALAAAKEAYVTEVETLEQTEIDTLALIALVSDVSVKSLDYVALDEYFNSITALEYADPTYSEAADFAVLNATDIVARYLEVVAMSEAFIENVAVMQTAENFKTKYSAYAICRDFYEDLDAAYEGIPEAVAAYDAYDKADIVALAAKYDALIAEIAKASYTTTFNATQTFIDNATALKAALIAEGIDVKDYPEMDYYIGKYDELNASQIAKKEAADAYIAAVNAIKSCTKFNDIKAAIDAAQALKATGNVSGIAGVDEANVYLSEKYTEIVCFEGYSKLYINTVNAIKEADTLAERRALLIEAAEYVGSTYVDYNGVSAAKTEYEAQFKAYNDAVKAANAAFNTVVTTAADAVATPATNQLNKVALVVKKFFE